MFILSFRLVVLQLIYLKLFPLQRRQQWDRDKGEEPQAHSLRKGKEKGDEGKEGDDTKKGSNDTIRVVWVLGELLFIFLHVL